MGLPDRFLELVFDAVLRNSFLEPERESLERYDMKYLTCMVLFLIVQPLWMREVR